MRQNAHQAAIAAVIEQAAAKRGWSLARLTRELGKGENTLARWRSGETKSIDVETLVKLFQFAGASMDQAFDLRAANAAVASEVSAEIERLDNEIDELRRQTALLKPLADLVLAFRPAEPTAPVATTEALRQVGVSEADLRQSAVNSTLDKIRRQEEEWAAQQQSPRHGARGLRKAE